jgi:hypothetical protein
MATKKNSVPNKIAAILALVIGLMAIFAGGKVLFGILPDYYVIDWLPIYNFVIGMVSALFSSVVIWKGNRFALPAAATTFGLHASVMLILQSAYREVVAPDSVMAMAVRLVVWTIVLTLLVAQQRKTNNANSRIQF